MYWNKHLAKLCKKYPLHLKCVLALPWEIWGDRCNRQRSTYAYLLMNHRIATKCLKIAQNCLKNRQMRSKLHHLYITCSKCPSPARTKMSEVYKLWRRMKNAWITLFIELAVGVVSPACMWLRSCWRQTFRAYHGKMMWLTTHLMIFETIAASRFVAIQWFIKMYV